VACLYVTEQGSKIRSSGGRIIVAGQDGSTRSVPVETLESIMLFGRVELTAKAQEECLSRGISVTFLSTRGHYFGRLQSTGHMNTFRLKKQMQLSENREECLKLTKKILEAKIHNQIVLARRYSRNRSDIDNHRLINDMSVIDRKIESSDSLEQALGYEGIAARAYFKILSNLIDEEFKFNGRNRRPPKDPFNSMISLGYTILLYEIYAGIEARSMSPYFGFIHQIRENHPTLASDLLEEWRAVIVDATVLSLIQGHEVNSSDFDRDPDTGGVMLNRTALSAFIRKLENKMRTETQYFDYLDHPVMFRRAIWWQTKTLAGCIDQGNFDSYRPLRIR
jgi:CRISPR-associated protein Cas1